MDLLTHQSIYIENECICSYPYFLGNVLGNSFCYLDIFHVVYQEMTITQGQDFEHVDTPGWTTIV